MGIVLAQLAQDDCDWIWNLGQGLNTQDGAAYAQSISEPWIQAGQAIYVLLTNREAQQAFTEEYGGEFGKYKLGWEILKGLGQDIYNAGTDLGNGAACHNANTFGRGLSRVALFLGNFVAGKLAARGLGYLLKGGGAGATAAEETAVVTAEESAASTAEESAMNAADDAAKPPATCSFSADTPVATDAGELPIGDIQVGDHVLAYDEAAGTTGTYTVTAVVAHADPAIERLTVDGEQLETTPEHPFFTQERAWVAAGALWNGAHLRKADGTYGVVEDIKVLQQPQVMYNLTVARAHTFFVGQQHWLVHNSCTPEISKISEDWGSKGAHIHVGKVELMVRPGENGTIVFKPFFSAISKVERTEAAAAIRVANRALANPVWRRQLYEAAARATEFLRKSGNPKWVAKSGETSFLMKALAKMGF